MLAASHSRGFAGASERTVRLVMHDLSHCSVGSNSGNRNKPPWCLMSCVELIEDRVLAKPQGCFMELLPVSSCCEVTVVDAPDETYSARHSR